MSVLRTMTAGMLSALLLSSAFAAPQAQAQGPAQLQHIEWEPCPLSVTAAGATCGRLDVPLRYDQPDGEKVSLGFVRVPASDPNKRGAIFTNPGGPGGDAYSFAAGDAMDFPAPIFTEWDVIGVQPRGLPGSTPLTCEVPEQSRPEQVARMSSDSVFAAGGLNRTLCRTEQPGFSASITTETNARDWNEVRRALGYEQVSILGLSYGTYLGATFATLFPQHTDKLVMDSAMNPQRAWNGIAADQQRGYELALHEYFAWVALNDHIYKMGNTPLKAYQYWAAKVTEQSGTNPTVLPPPARVGDLPAGLEFAGQAGADVLTATGKARVEGEGVLTRILNPGANQALSPLLAQTRMALPSPKHWDDLARLTNGTIAPEKMTLPTEEQQKFAVEQIIALEQLQAVQWCNENTVPADVSLYPSLAWSMLTQDPFTLPHALRASGWYCNGAGPIAPVAALDGAKLRVAPLQLSGTRDPQTPYHQRSYLADAMRAKLVTVNGPGHGHFGTGNRAVDALVVQYLRTGHVERSEVPGYWEAR